MGLQVSFDQENLRVLKSGTGFGQREKFGSLVVVNETCTSLAEERMIDPLVTTGSSDRISRYLLSP